jgi:methionyl-tRNA synthetase
VAEVGEHIEAVRLRAGLASAMAAAQEVNAYLNEREPWKTAKEDLARTGSTLFVALNAVAGINLAFTPYLPFSSTAVRETLGLAEEGWAMPAVAVGTRLGAPEPLFVKVED